MGKTDKGVSIALHGCFDTILYSMYFVSIYHITEHNIFI
jgi:hypothetical protein